MLSIARRNKILEILKEKHQITTQELEKELNVSGATVRNDLQELEKEGLLKRIHGGAVLPKEQIFQNSYRNFHHRSKKNVQEKKAICRAASKFIDEGQTYLLDASSTVLYLVPYLREKHRISIATNGLYTALEVKEICNINVIVLGGIAKPRSGSLEGLLGESILCKINADIMFTSAHGFTLKDGLTDFNVYEVELKNKMVSKSKKVIALLDHTKIGYTSTTSFCSIDNLDVIVTDNKTPSNKIEEIRNAGIEVIVAE
ncbi:DeoR/GlpR family DNA-binding transcription regulator [Halothermothrix orenii]|uniref:Transcriptional regulator, DeoR family n=1 Tax=Halothermothrix orenii (strain H 168 / OCM 544 / DSM 9562) TaxID=373903 RepID=B8D1K7_HALOH|nr:DeoR/GlpR family DNA-binding transcription regulator [Halothermothrix orenii]ACL69084.1 transcriptional regulator, DeoR family [Halothermothrix orenii H 168]